MASEQERVRKHRQFLRYRHQAAQAGIPYKATRKTSDILSAKEPPRPTAGGYRSKGHLRAKAKKRY